MLVVGVRRGACACDGDIHSHRWSRWSGHSKTRGLGLSYVVERAACGAFVCDVLCVLPRAVQNVSATLRPSRAGVVCLWFSKRGVVSCVSGANVGCVKLCAAHCGYKLYRPRERPRQAAVADPVGCERGPRQFTIGSLGGAMMGASRPKLEVWQTSATDSPPASAKWPLLPTVTGQRLRGPPPRGQPPPPGGRSRRVRVPLASMASPRFVHGSLATPGGSLSCSAPSEARRFGHSTVLPAATARFAGRSMASTSRRTN